MKLQAIMLNSENPEKLVEFYNKVVGQSEWSSGPFTGWNVDGLGLMVGPHSEVKGENKEPGRIMMTFACDDVKAEFDRIKSAGATVISEPVHPGGAPDGEDELLLACLADPDGNYFQLSTPFDPNTMK